MQDLQDFGHPVSRMAGNPAQGRAIFRDWGACFPNETKCSVGKGPCCSSEAPGCREQDHFPSAIDNGRCVPRRQHASPGKENDVCSGLHDTRDAFRILTDFSRKEKTLWNRDGPVGKLWRAASSVCSAGRKEEIVPARRANPPCQAGAVPCRCPRSPPMSMTAGEDSCTGLAPLPCGPRRWTRSAG